MIEANGKLWPKWAAMATIAGVLGAGAWWVAVRTVPTRGEFDEHKLEVAVQQAKITTELAQIHVTIDAQAKVSAETHDAVTRIEIALKAGR